MRIDFHTHYSERDFGQLIEQAKRLGLDGLVMTGLDSKKEVNVNGILVFPAQKVNWTARLKMPSYKSWADFSNGKPSSGIKKDYHGKSLIIVPSNTQFERQETELSVLIGKVNDLGGAIIALQDDSNWPITYSGKKTYPFDAVRIRAGNPHDIHSEMPFAEVKVAGSHAYNAEQLRSGAFTFYYEEFSSQEQLIDAIKRKLPTRLFVHRNGKQIGIKDTVAPLGIDCKDYLRRIGFE